MVNKKGFVGMLLAMLASGLVVSCTITLAGSLAQTSYTEGDVYVAASNVTLHYYFSSTPEGIEQAAFNNGINTLNPSIKNFPWVVNTVLDDNVKKAMNDRNVVYSATVHGQDFIVNRYNNGTWYFASYTINTLPTYYAELCTIPYNVYSNLESMNAQGAFQQRDYCYNNRIQILDLQYGLSYNDFSTWAYNNLNSSFASQVLSGLNTTGVVIAWYPNNIGGYTYVFARKQ